MDRNFFSFWAAPKEVFPEFLEAFYEFRIESLHHHVHNAKNDLDCFLLEEFHPQVEIPLSISADVGELRLRKRLRMIIRTWYDNGRITHILAYSVPYAKMCLAVLEHAVSLGRLVTLTVLRVGLLESPTELDADIHECFLIMEVLDKS